MMGRFLLRVIMASSILFSASAFALEESAKHAKVREFACGNDPYQQCMDALIRLCGNPARMACAIKHQTTLSKISRDAAQ
jgi:hypothetical protein